MNQLTAQVSQDIDTGALSRLLQQATGAEIRFDSGTRAVYASEASNYRQVPVGVVIPRTLDDVVATHAICSENGVPVLARGAGTSMCGQSVNAAVVIDMSKHLHQIELIDAARRTATVLPGVICDQLKDAAAQHGLTFGPDPASHSRCTLGGMIGNNSCGAHSVMAGKTAENIEALEILTYDGARFWVGPTDDAALHAHLSAGGRQAQIVAALRDFVERYAEVIRSGFPALKRRVSGYALDQLLPENGFNIARALVGSEGTLATVLRARTMLVTNPTHRQLVVFGFPSIFDAADCVPQLLELHPIAMEGLDTGIVGGLKARGLALDDIAELPDGAAWLMVEFGAQDEARCADQVRCAVALAPALPGAPSVRAVADAGLIKRLWSVRETGASATSLGDDPSRADPVVGWEDAAVEPRLLGAYLREFAALVERYGYQTNLYGHFGDGCIHARITFDLRSAAGVTTWRAFLDEAARLVVKYGGSLSGEHGDGQSRGELLPLMYSPEMMQAFRAFKAIWDPANRMNPGKLIDAMPVDTNLRLGPAYRRIDIESPLRFGDAARPDSFARATERCIGMGKCRSLSGATMCPSYRATRDEAHSTRGRARLLFEMLQGEVIEDAWRSEAVKASLDTCLACKGCRSDCPTHVDMAKYRSHFLYEYFRRKRRPLMDALVGRIGVWLPHATRVSGLVNPLMRNRALRRLGAAAGLAQQVEFAPIAARSFRAGAAARKLLRRTARKPRGPAARREVLLWTDTFNNGFTPDVLEAALRVLEHHGFAVRLLERQICCGRPFYDSGMLDHARRHLDRIITSLADVIDQRMPVVVLEPSCLSVFRDELRALLPDDVRATQLSRAVVTLAELLQQHGVTLPRVPGAVRVHGHCHQKACGGLDAEAALIDAASDDGRMLATGCCGMAGAYGYHTRTAEIAARVAASELTPALAALPAGATVISDGFSCRTQIRHTSGHEALHLAQWLDRETSGRR